MQVQRAGLPEPMEGEEDTVRGGLPQPEPVGVAGVHAARRRAGLQGRLQPGQSRLHHHVPGAYTKLPHPLPCSPVLVVRLAGVAQRSSNFSARREAWAPRFC
jgi:hypothetical protein